MAQQNFFTQGPSQPDQGGDIRIYGRRQPPPALMPPDPQNYGGTYTAPPYSSPGQTDQTPGVPQYPSGYVPRKFFYKGQEYLDPGPEFTPQDVLDALAANTVQELRGGTWTSERQRGPDGIEREYITFKKVSGEKGVSVTAAGIEDWKIIRFGTFGLILICQVMLGVIGAILMMMAIKPKK